MEAFLNGTKLSIPWHGDVYWFDREECAIGLNGNIPKDATLVLLPEDIARRFIDELDLLASQFPKKGRKNPEYTRRRQQLLAFAEEELGPYMEETRLLPIAV